ncbi:MAG: hypothetical protein NZ840_04195 [Anaerolineales bacterium]|nr:hypothetical protein [Anaerolineales bacterium]MDW8161235.1 hypothetical protein [Anaerolineales bacterium]
MSYRGGLMRLEDWENRLKPYLSQIELLGEIPLSREEHAELEKMLGKLVQQCGLTEATRRLRKDYPAVFVTYLAFQAALNEERGFWDRVAQGIGIDTPSPLFHPSHHWGKIFVEILQSYPNLRQFEGVSGLKFVTPIRLHGGIPAFSLPDFFKHILLPSVQNSHYSQLEDEAALAALLKHYTVELFVDDIVRYFFRHGGKHALSFFRKCRQMARAAIRGEPLPTAEVLGLRPYVLQAFEQYLQNPPEPSHRRRLPRLFFEPYEPAFRLFLPAQPVASEEAGYAFFWRISYVRGEIEVTAADVRVRTRRTGQEWQTEEVSEFLLVEPAEHARVSLIARGEEEKTVLKHSLRLLPATGAPPLLAFRFEDGAQRAISPYLPAQTTWLFYPADVSLDFQGKARQVQVLHPFAPPWEAWQAQAWDLQGVHLIRLLRHGVDICPPLLVRATQEPALEGHAVHAQSLPVEEKPLFLGAPRLRLPLRNTHNPQEELGRWQLSIESNGMTHPQGRWEGRASQLPAQIQPQEGCARLDLSPWLGQKPIGSFQLVARGAAREEFLLPFHVWHEIRIEGLQPYYLPSAQGAEEVCFLISLPEDCRLRSLQEEEVKVSKSSRGWQVRVTREADQAYLALEYPRQSEIIWVPLKLAVPRLCWTLQLDASAKPQWHSSALRISLADLQRSRPARLRVVLPLVGSYRLLAVLHLRSPALAKTLQSSRVCEITSLQPKAEFQLDEFSDTLRRHIREAVFDFVLELRDLSHNLSLPVLRLTQELDIRVPPYFERLADGRWRIHWFERDPVRHRRLRLWSLWQPWAQPVEIPLPDDAPASNSAPAEGWWMVEVPEEIGLPPAWYRVQFLALAPDDAPPISDDPPQGSIQVELIDPKVRLKQIEQELIQHPNRAFALHAEKACIYDSLKLTQQRDMETRWCVSHWEEGSLLHLFAFQRWLAGRDPDTRRALLIHLFRPESLRKLKTYPEQFVQKYLDLISEVQIVKPESAWLILQMAKKSEALFRALQILVKDQDAQAVEHIWREVKAGRVSKTDAIQLLSINAAFAASELLRKEDTPLRSDLLVELSRYCPIEGIVRVGYWVFSEAGWGRLVEIRGARHAEAFEKEKEQPILVIALWDSATTLDVDLAREEISMRGRSGAYRCGCNRFIATRGEDCQEAWNRHAEVCDQTENMSPIRFPYAMRERIVYSPTKPENIYGHLPTSCGNNQKEQPAPS